VANALGVQGAGMVAFALWIALVLTPIIDGGATLSVGRFPAQLRGQDKQSAAQALPGILARRLLLYHVVSLAALLAVFVLLQDHPEASSWTIQAEISRIPLHAVVIVAVLTSLQSLALFAAADLRSSQSFGTLAVLAFVSMLVQLGSVYAGARFYGVPGALCGYLCGQICLALVTLSRIGRRGRLAPSQAREVWRYGRYSWAANICNTFVWSRIEILFLQVFWSYHEVGWFSVALALSSLASQGPLLLTGAFLPMLAQKHGERDRAGLQSAFIRGTRMLALIALPVCLVMAAVVPALVDLIYGAAFAPASPAAMIIVTAAAFTATTVIGTHLVNALGRSDFIFFSSLAGALLSAVLGLLLIPRFELVGAAVSRATVQLAMVALGMWFITWKLGFRFPLGSSLRILLASAVAAGAAYAIVSVDHHPAALAAAVAMGGIVYVLCLRLFGAVHAEDVRLARRLLAPLPRPLARLADGFLLFIYPGPGAVFIITTTR
jgi:O-antigen/teichoic acid export membrane protein